MMMRTRRGTGDAQGRGAGPTGRREGGRRGGGGRGGGRRAAAAALVPALLLPRGAANPAGASDAGAAPAVGGPEQAAAVGAPEQAAAALASVVIPGAYWWFVLVPSERRSLARSKRKGAVDEYLNELEEEGGGGRALERWFYTDWLRVRRGMRARAARRAAGAAAPSAQEAARDDADVEKVEGIEDRSSLDGVDDPAFLALDNPLVVAAALIAVGVAAAYAVR